jgi:hypothetical protein
MLAKNNATAVTDEGIGPGMREFLMAVNTRIRMTAKNRARF